MTQANARLTRKLTRRKHRGPNHFLSCRMDGEPRSAIVRPSEAFCFDPVVLYNRYSLTKQLVDLGRERMAYSTSNNTTQNT